MTEILLLLLGMVFLALTSIKYTI